MTHWLRQLRRTQLQPMRRTRPRNITSIRYPYEVTCACGVRTAQNADGVVRPHGAKLRARIKHHGVSYEAQAICATNTRPL